MVKNSGQKPMAVQIGKRHVQYNRYPIMVTSLQDIQGLSGRVERMFISSRPMLMVQYSGQRLLEGPPMMWDFQFNKLLKADTSLQNGQSRSERVVVIFIS